MAKVALPDLGILDRLAAHLASIREGLELKERKAWWEVRLRADHALKVRPICGCLWLQV